MYEEHHGPLLRGFGLGRPLKLEEIADHLALTQTGRWRWRCGVDGRRTQHPLPLHLEWRSNYFADNPHGYGSVMDGQSFREGCSVKVPHSLNGLDGFFKTFVWDLVQYRMSVFSQGGEGKGCIIAFFALG
jgi:hypothetical protein